MQSPLKKLLKQTQDVEVCCDSPEICQTDSGCVCQSCGAVLSKRLVNTEASQYTTDDVQKKKVNETRWREFGPRTMIGKNEADFLGLKPERRCNFHRLAKIQGSLIGSVERNLSEARPVLNTIAEQLSLPKYIVETAWRIYEQVAAKQMTMGRSIRSFCAASLCVAIRIHNFPRIIEQMYEIALVSERSLMQAIQKIKFNVLPDMNLRYHSTSSMDFSTMIQSIGASMDLPQQVISHAIILANQAVTKGLKCNGQNPKGFVAAFLYRAGVEQGFKRNQQDVADACFITEVTLRTRLRELAKIVPSPKQILNKQAKAEREHPSEQNLMSYKSHPMKKP